MEQFFTNIELVTNLCKYLNYEEQFKLSQVASDLEYIIVNYVWNIKFQEIQIITNQTLFIVSDTTQAVMKYVYGNKLRPDIWLRKGFLITTKNMEIFLNLNKNNVKKLQIICEKDQEKNESIECLKNVLTFGQTFPNLTELSCWNMKLENMDLQRVAQNFLKLETLILNNCYGGEDNRPLEIGIDIDIQTIKDIKNLKAFTINRWPYSSNSTLAVIKNVINQLKLQQLVLNGITITDCSRNNKSVLNLNNLKYYKELDIWQLLLYKTYILSHFENLCNLTLRCDESTFINEDFFDNLLKSCKSLTRLHLICGLTKHFKVLPSLNELILENCEGLTYSNLKTILSEMHLKCFKSLCTTYQGNFEKFRISPFLQHLEIITRDKNVMKLLKFNEANLINLTEFLYHARDADEKLIVSNFGKNLKVLSINSDPLMAEDCLKLKCLQKLVIYDSIAVSDFLLLLKHENLHELSIRRFYFWPPPYPIKPPQTNLRYLRLQFDLAHDPEADFLLKILDLNKKLSVAFDALTTSQSIVNLLNNRRKFPKHIKNINVGGISIGCNYIQNECEETMKLINDIIQSFRKRHSKAYFILQ